MLKYWLRDENSTVGINIFGNVFEVDVLEREQAEFEANHPGAELVGDNEPATFDSVMASSLPAWEKHNALVDLGLKDGPKLGDPMDKTYDAGLYE